MKTIAEVRATNKANGMCFFDRQTMRFWGSKIHGGVRRGKYFITSEHNYNRTERRFSVRAFSEDGDIATVGEFQGYRTLQEAKDAINLLEGK